MKNFYNKMHVINMCSSANTVKGQGVGSAYDEQTSIIKNKLKYKFTVIENSKLKADITHYHTINLPYYLSIPKAKMDGVTVGYVHFLPETVEQSLRLPYIAKKVFYKYLISFYDSMDYLVTVNPYFIDCLEKYGVDRDKVTYIPNYVDDSMFFALPDKEKHELYNKYSLSPSKFTVVCAGQLQTRKGVFDFVKCAELLPDVQFVWAGGFSFGRMADGYNPIKKLLSNPPKNIKFLGIVDREDMNGIYNIGDVMFLPSFEELFPMTILEAMCIHKPILLRDIPIYENILFDYYLKADDIDGFVEKIKSLRDNADFYKKASDQSLKGNLFYNKDHVMKMWDDFYTSILTDKLPKRLSNKG